MEICKKCGTTEKYKDGRCKECRINYNKRNREEINRKYREYCNIPEVKEKIQKKNKNQYYKNKEKRREYGKQYYQKNEEKIKQYKIEYRKSNKEKINEYSRTHRKITLEKHTEYEREYRKKNLEKVKKKEKKYKLSPKGRETAKRSREKNKIHRNISNAILKHLKNNKSCKNNKSILDYLPFTIQQLKDHLESQFKSWMSWNNYGGRANELRKTWWIDHIIPHSKLLYDSMTHSNFQKCWSLENLRPLEKMENIRKGNK